MLIINGKPFVWTASKLVLAQECLRSFYYEYVNKPRVRAPIKSDMALGIFIHREIQLLHMHYKREGKAKYKRPESFAGAAAGKWKRFVAKTSKIRGLGIEWKFDGQQWALVRDLKDMCTKYYERFLDEAPPIFTEHGYRFLFGDIIYSGVIDEVRQGRRIRDHKSGYKEFKQMGASYEYQFTFYALAFSCLLRTDEAFRRAVGITDEEAARFGGNPDFIDDKLTLEFNYLRSGNIVPTSRRNEHYFELRDTIRSLEEKIMKRKFDLNRNYCDRCIHTQECDRDTVRFAHRKPQYEQLVLIESRPSMPKENLQLKLL